ncbi:MAG: DUF1552 domain-containing protein [Lentisphaeraceae bacterium]|nr:DUF1552 domain-containing protein [Lentisphaeraceae bacterium]
MKQLNRRTVLRGIGGITLGLPWLEAMAQSSYSPKNIRLAYIFFPNGVIENHWTPDKGKLDQLPKTLTSLEPVKDMVNVHTGLTHNTFCGHIPGTANFLSGAVVKKGLGELKVGKSTDQVAADHLGQYTAFPSLELSLQGVNSPGLDNHGYNKTMGGYISWSDEKTPVPREGIPLNAYNRLFKGAKKSTTTPAETKSMLDYIKEDTSAMKRSLGREDNYRIDQYFASVRALEKRIQKATQTTLKMPRTAQRPDAGLTGDIRKDAAMMIDIIVLALQTNRTKVASLMLGKALGNGTKYGFLGVPGGPHETSHHNNNPKKMKDVETITSFQVSLYSQLLQKMHAVKEGNETLLDNSLVLFGSDLWCANRHSTFQKPIIVAGKGGGSVKTGTHKVHNSGTPLNNLYLGMMKTAGCPVKKFGDSKTAII